MEPNNVISKFLHDAKHTRIPDLIALVNAHGDDYAAKLNRLVEAAKAIRIVLPPTHVFRDGEFVGLTERTRETAELYAALRDIELESEEKNA